MFTTWFFAWWNLVFVVPFFLALMYLGIYTVSGLTVGESELESDLHGDVEGGLHADADLHGDAEIHAEADLHAEVDLHGDAGGDLHGDAELEGDADLHADADADVHAEAEADGDAHPAVDGEASGHASISGPAHTAPLYMSAMSWLGLGKLPISMLLMVLFLTWGVIGFLINFALTPLVPYDWMASLVSLPVAAICSTSLTRGLVRVMIRWMPMHETYARGRRELVGTSGEAIYDIDRTFGLVSVRDRRGDLFHVACRVYEDQPVLPKGTRVLLVDYNLLEEFYYVTKYDVKLD